MDYQKQQVTAQEKANEYQDKANELQQEANELQQEMITETKINNEVTSNHNRAIRLLTKVIVVVGIVSVMSGFMINRNKTGRYAIAGGEGGVYLVNTKTSQLWIRTGSGHSLYLGTNENPAHEVIPLKPKNEQKQ